MKQRAAFLLSAILALSLAVAAQNLQQPGLEGSISGSVRTADNHAVPNARIEIRSLTSAGIVSVTYSNKEGQFQFDDLKPGQYEVVATSGLLDVREQVKLDIRETVNLHLPPSTDDGAGGSNTVSVNQFKVPGKARDAFKKAEAAAQKLKLDEAEKFLAKALEIHPQYAEAMALRGILKLDSNNAQGASSDLEQAVQFDPGYAFSYIVLAAAYNTLERFDDALLTVDRGVALAPPPPGRVTLRWARRTWAKGNIRKRSSSSTRPKTSRPSSLLPST